MRRPRRDPKRRPQVRCWRLRSASALPRLRWQKQYPPRRLQKQSPLPQAPLLLPLHSRAARKNLPPAKTHRKQPTLPWQAQGRQLSVSSSVSGRRRPPARGGTAALPPYRVVSILQSSQRSANPHRSNQPHRAGRTGLRLSGLHGPHVPAATFRWAVEIHHADESVRHVGLFKVRNLFRRQLHVRCARQILDLLRLG